MKKTAAQTERDKLLKFIRSYFGGSFYKLLMYGLDSPAGCLPHSFSFSAITAPGGKSEQWIFEVENCDSIGRGDEPLVIAALLKLYLERGTFRDEPGDEADNEFRFGAGEICDELGWIFDQAAEDRIETAIGKHALVSAWLVPANPDRKNRAAGSRQGGKAVDGRRQVCRGLLFDTGSYITEPVGEKYPRLSRRITRVKLHDEFVAGLRAGKIMIGRVCLSLAKPE